MATFQEALEASLEYYGGDDLPAKTFVDKYALRDLEGNYLELTPDDMHHRLAKEFARIEQKYPNPRSEEEIYQALRMFNEIVPQGSPMSAIGNPFKPMSLSNCVIVHGPEDSVHSIMDVGKNLAQLFKRRCGVGTGLTALRPAGALVNNAALTTTGAWSFSEYYSNIARMIGQGGRRAALLLHLDIRHPDAFDFATMKRDLSKVTGANISFQIVDEFMVAVRDDTDFLLRWPVDDPQPKYSRVVRARDLWNVIIEAVRVSAEPGLLFWDTICRELPSDYYHKNGFKTIGCNPCGELPASGEDSCRLTALNLYGFVRNRFAPDAWFDYDALARSAQLAQRLLDDIVDIELECIDRILLLVDSEDERDLWEKLRRNCELGRRTGLGTFGLADALACLRIRYDSDAAISTAGKIFETIRNASYTESVNLAKERGSFPIWDWEAEKECPFIQRLPETLKLDIQKFGRRNIANLTNAPTGSVAIVAGNRSSGIEPVFRNAYTRRKKINAGDEGCRVDFVDQTGDKWQEFNVFHRNVADWIRENHPDWDGVSLVELPDIFVCAEEIDWKRAVDIQAAIQVNIDHAISRTINLPKTVTAEEISSIYMRAWEKGLKGVTVYVDGTRSGVLVAKHDDDNDRPTTVKRTKAPKRPPVLPVDIYHGKVQGEKWTIVVGLLEGEPYELFGGPSEDIDIPKSAKSGYMSKRTLGKNKHQYDLTFFAGGEEKTIIDIGNVFENKSYGTFTRILSLSLRHGAPVQHIVEQLGKDQSEELNSLSSVLRRALKKYVADGAVAKGSCERCGSSNLRYSDGCPQCLQCGFSRCS